MVQKKEDLEISEIVENTQTTELRSTNILIKVLKIWGDLSSLKHQWKTMGYMWYETFQKSQRWASPDAGRKHFIDQSPGPYNSVRELLLHLLWHLLMRGKQLNNTFLDLLMSPLTKELLVTLVTSTQILKSPIFWYSYNIKPMIKISNQNITQSRNQTIGLCVMIAGALLRADRRADSHPANFSFFFSSVRTTTWITTQTRDTNTENGVRKTTNCISVFRCNST